MSIKTSIYPPYSVAGDLFIVCGQSFAIASLAYSLAVAYTDLGFALLVCASLMTALLGGALNMRHFIRQDISKVGEDIRENRGVRVLWPLSYSVGLVTGFGLNYLGSLSMDGLLIVAAFSVAPAMKLAGYFALAGAKVYIWMFWRPPDPPKPRKRRKRPDTKSGLSHF